MKYATLAALVGAAIADDNTDCKNMKGNTACFQYKEDTCKTIMQVDGKDPDEEAQKKLADKVNAEVEQLLLKGCYGYMPSDDKKSYKNYIGSTCDVSANTVTMMSYTDPECKTKQEGDGAVDVKLQSGTCITLNEGGTGGQAGTPQYYACDVPAAKDDNSAKTFGASVAIATLAIASTLF